MPSFVVFLHSYQLKLPSTPFLLPAQRDLVFLYASYICTSSLSCSVTTPMLICTSVPIIKRMYQLRRKGFHSLRLRNAGWITLVATSFFLRSITPKRDKRSHREGSCGRKMPPSRMFWKRHEEETAGWTEMNKVTNFGVVARRVL